MPVVPFHFAGQTGIVKDLPAHELPPHAWSDGQNMRFRNGRASKVLGVEQIFGTPSVDPYWLMFGFSSTSAFWMYSDLSKMYATDGVTHTEITRSTGGDYTTQIDKLWVGGILSGIPVITNTIDVPQAWPQVGLANNLEDLDNWPSTDRCDVIKPFKNFLVAGAITRSGTYYPHMVKWSHPADPGAVPSSWDAADPAFLAGERDLVDAFPGAILDMLQLRDMLVIYKDNTVWGMQFIGGQEVMRTYLILAHSGIISRRCCKEVHEGRAHVLGMQDDFMMFDGQTVNSVVDKRLKSFITNTLVDNQASAFRSYVVVQELTTEAWFCIPEVGNEWPNLAIVWNWRDNTIAIRELISGTTAMEAGTVTDTTSVWNTDSEVWDDDDSIWDVINLRPSFFSLTGAIPDQTKIVNYDIGTQNLGANFTGFVERTDIALVGRDRLTGDYKADLENRKLCKRIWPKMKPGSNPIQVKIGSQEFIGGPVTYQAAQAFDPATQRYLDFSVSGLLIAVWMGSEDAGEFDIEGFDLEIEIVGRM